MLGESVTSEFHLFLEERMPQRRWDSIQRRFRDKNEEHKNQEREFAKSMDGAVTGM